MRPNPKLSSKNPGKGSKPKAPTAQEVPDEEIDHAGDNPAAVPLRTEEPPTANSGAARKGSPPEPVVDAGGAYDPSTEDPQAAGQDAQDQVQKPEEGDPGKVKRQKHVRGVLPGDRMTY